MAANGRARVVPVSSDGEVDSAAAAGRATRTASPDGGRARAGNATVAMAPRSELGRWDDGAAMPADAPASCDRRCARDAVRGERLGRVRVTDPGKPGPDDVVAAESGPAGAPEPSAPAVPTPPTTDPIPSTTARAPTRPTNADAAISVPPAVSMPRTNRATGHQVPGCHRAPQPSAIIAHWQRFGETAPPLR